jgi:hypothetical protein
MRGQRFQAVIEGPANMAFKIEFVEQAANARFSSLQRWIENAKLVKELELW